MERQGQKWFKVLLSDDTMIQETGSVGETLREAGHINKSLYVLGKVSTTFWKNQKLQA